MVHGRAGQLLTKIIEACAFSAAKTLSCLKRSMPAARQSSAAAEEEANCRGFLERQLALIKPEYICCLGAVAAALLKTQTPIGKFRGTFHQLGDAQVICTYHPAYLLGCPAKKDVWEDMKMLMLKMGIDCRAAQACER